MESKIVTYKPKLSNQNKLKAFLSKQDKEKTKKQ